MKLISYLPLLLICFYAQAQTGTPAVPAAIKPVAGASIAGYVKGSTVATLSVGFIDEYRGNYTVPAGFSLNNKSGFAPVYGKLEYGVSNKVSLGATFCYDVFYANFYHLYQANGNEYKRYATDKFRSFSGGLAAYYHFKSLIPIKKLDVFAGVGFSLNNIQHSAMPQGDSTAGTTEHTVSPILKAGARYYLSNYGSLFADLGYDRATIFSLGFSCRFLKK